MESVHTAVTLESKRVWALSSNRRYWKSAKVIMEIYDINQFIRMWCLWSKWWMWVANYTLEMGVDSQKSLYRWAWHHSPKNWGLYSLAILPCIVCERCVTVCKDMIGDAALKTVPRGGAELIKSWKDKTVAKDVYAMWNKSKSSLSALQVGLIA